MLENIKTSEGKHICGFTHTPFLSLFPTEGRELVQKFKQFLSLKFEVSEVSKPSLRNLLPTRGKVWGFTLIELLFAVAISILLLTVTLSAFYSYRKRQAVDVSAQVVLSTLREARSKTLDSLNGIAYGVHIGAKEVVLFQGSSYDPSNSTNEIKLLARPAEVTDKTFVSNEVLFARLSGDASPFGTITVAIPGDLAVSKRVVIESTGISYVE